MVKENIFLENTSFFGFLKKRQKKKNYEHFERKRKDFLKEHTFFRVKTEGS